MLKHKLFIVFLLFFYCTVCCSQRYSYKQYTILDGLVQNQVMSLFQDSKGFIWIGTKAGVSRFDGVNFKNYTAKDGLPVGATLNIFEDSKYNIFFVTSSGIAVLKNNKFKTICNHTWTDNGKVSFLNNKAYITTINEIFECDADSCKLYLKSNKDCGFEYFHTFENNKKFINTICGYFEILKNGTFIKQNLKEIIKWPEYGWYAFTLPLNTFDGCSSKFQYFNYNKIRSISTYFPISNQYDLNDIEKNKFIFSNHRSGWIISDSTGKKLEGDENPDFIAVNAFLIDSEGTLWLGAEAGLFHLQSFAFRNYEKESGIDKNVWSIAQAPDRAIWFATYEGKLFKFQNDSVFKVKGYEHFLKYSNFYMSGFCDTKGRVLIPKGDKNIFVIYKNRFSKLFKNDEHAGFICTYEYVEKNLLLFGSIQWLYVYNNADKSLKKFPIKDQNVVCMEADKYGRIWINNTSKNVLLFDGEKFVDFNKNELKPNERIISCKRDGRGNMWFSSRTGLFCYTYDKKFKVLDVPCHFISLYKNRYIVAGSILGFYVIDLDKFYALESNFYKYYDRYNGFIGIECGQNGTLVDVDGNIWIPTSDRVVKFMPEKVKENKNPPIIHFYSLACSSKDLKWNNILEENNDSVKCYNLKHFQHNVRIEYHGISYSCPERVKYKTRLIGFNDNWSETAAKIATYTNLDPGEYVFEVLACNADGIWNDQPARIKFKIIPAFWQTWWFLMLSIITSLLIIIYIIYLYFWLKKQKEQKQREVERNLATLQLNTINAQIDPHFVFNAITAIGVEVQKNNNEKAYNYFVKVSNLLRNSLKNNNKIIRSLKEELEFVENYLLLQKYRFGERFDYKINILENIDLEFEIPKMCIQIFVENAIKHGLEHKLSGGLLEINISKNEKSLNIVVADNGIGRKQAAQYSLRSTGIGLNVQKRFFQINNSYNTEKAHFDIEDLIDKNGDPAGTKVILIIPFNYKFIT